MADPFVLVPVTLTSTSGKKAARAMSSPAEAARAAAQAARVRLLLSSPMSTRSMRVQAFCEGASSGGMTAGGGTGAGFAVPGGGVHVSPGPGAVLAVSEDILAQPET